MLHTETYSKLIKHSWSKMLKKESNPSQTQNRIRSQCNRMLSELSLLADQIPEVNLKTAEKENIAYWFKWEELPGRDDVRLLDYLESELGQTYFIRKMEKNTDGKVLTFSTQC